jgi:hypothetical protein
MRVKQAAGDAKTADMFKQQTKKLAEQINADDILQALEK